MTTTTASTTATERRRLTALRAARMFDGVATATIPNPTVLLDGESIVAVGRSMPVPDGAELIDLGDVTILPGLIDTHLHLAFDASEDPVGRLAQRDDAAAFMAMGMAARNAVREGVTTIRDLGDRGYLSLGLRDAARTDRTLPTIVAAGPPITSPSGHCHYLGGEASGVDGVRAAVREHADRGVDVIKIMASGGNLTPGTRVDLPQFALDELRTAVDEAHRLNLPIAAHAHGRQAIIDVIAAGVDGIEHLSFMTPDGVDDIPSELLQELGTGRVQVGLTLGSASAPSGAMALAMLARLPKLVANATLLYEVGAPLGVGTDAGVAISKPHGCLRHALQQFLAIGPSPTEALITGTSRNAAMCGLGDRKGRIAAGYDADLLVVAGDPTEDLAALGAIQAVYVRGALL